MLPAPSARLAAAMSKLKSLQQGDLGVIEVAAFGLPAIPFLEELLFDREPSGLYQVRCRAAETLGHLKAYDVLFRFLNERHYATDPIERAGDDAVINAAALTIAKSRDDRAFHLLLQLAQRPDLIGVIGALGSFDRIEAIPRLIEALADDGSRLTAENALRRMGKGALRALSDAAGPHTTYSEQESESRRRQRMSIARLITEISTADGLLNKDN